MWLEAPEASPQAEQTLYCGHIFVAPEYSMGSRSSGPLTQAPEAPEWEPMKYGSASCDLGRLSLRAEVGAGPKNGLGDCHIQEVFPSFGLEFLHFLLEGLLVVL